MITLNELQDLFEAAEALPSKPSFQEYPVYVITDTIDEDKTVKWNREEVRKRMKAREDEIKRLRAIKADRIQEAHQYALQYIHQETGLNTEKAEILWNFVIMNFQVRQIDIWQQLDMQIELFNELK